MDAKTHATTSQKRKHDEMNKMIDNILHTPKKKTKFHVEQYVYKSLFLEGQNSDVTICVLGQELNLHKIMLSQSPYFSSMFNGPWVETTKGVINIDIVDSFITTDAIKVVFGYLYNSEISIKPLEVVSILATAMMFQLDGLIEDCKKVMIETLNAKTALKYYDAASRYANEQLRTECFNWFQMNLMSYDSEHAILDIKNIPITLMTKLVNHQRLLVIQTEYSIYTMLKYWVFLQQNPENDKLSSQHRTQHVNDYFSDKTKELPFLLTSDGEQYVSVFKGLRLQNMTLYNQDLKTILSDNIIPKTWLNPILLKQWTSAVELNEQREDRGPSNVSNKVFLETSLRCGQIIPDKGKHKWSWNNYNLGLNLLMINELTLSIKKESHLFSFQGLTHIMIKVKILKLNEQGQIVYTKNSKIIKATLKKGEEINIMKLDANIKYPFIISANILNITPHIDEEPQAMNMENVQ